MQAVLLKLIGLCEYILLSQNETNRCCILLAIHLRCTNGNISPGKIYFANGPTLYSLAIHLRCTAATSHKLDDFYNVSVF